MGVLEGLVNDVGDGLRSALGGIQGSVNATIGGADVDVAFGERRVFSWTVIVAALLVGYLIGRAR